MPLRCVQITLPDGTSALVRVIIRLCSYCDAVSERLCDGPGARAGKTCDRPMCARHSLQVGDMDFCREHEGFGNRLRAAIAAMGEK